MVSPTLVAIDAHALTARRYFPKPDGGYMVDEVGLCAREDQDEKMVDALEQFRINGHRQGRRHINRDPLAA